MKLIPVDEAVGHVLCHDHTQIIRGVTKGVRFPRGHVVRPEDIPVLRSMGKEHLYVWENLPGMLHEDEGAARLCALCRGEHMEATAPKEGKIELLAACDGLFRVDTARLAALNRVDEVMVATRHTNSPVRAGDRLAGMRVIPLVIAGERLDQAGEAVGTAPLLELLPYTKKTAAIIATGSEIASGLIADTFTPVVEEKLAAYGISVLSRHTPGDDKEAIAQAIRQCREAGAELVLCTGGMSVDPDDRTPGAIRASGAHVITYGAPVLPGAMFLVADLEGVPVLGLPGCVMFAAATIFDLILPRVAAGVAVTRDDIIALGHGGLCLGCTPCRFPLCPFGKSI